MSIPIPTNNNCQHITYPDISPQGCALEVQCTSIEML